MAQIISTSERIRRLDYLFTITAEEARRIHEQQMNIVQAEFFHVGGERVASLGTLFDEIVGRVTVNAPIKTTVRFLDEDCSMTNFALTAQSLERQSERLRARVIAARGIKQLLLDYKLRRLTGKIIRIKARGLPLTIDRLSNIAKASKKIGIELSDRSFRLIHNDEMHELLESVQRARDVWIFIFNPNDMFSDTQTILTSVM